MKKLKVLLVVLFAMVANIGLAVEVEFSVSDGVNTTTHTVKAWSGWSGIIYDVELPTSTTEFTASLYTVTRDKTSSALLSSDSTKFIQSEDDSNYLYSKYNKNENHTDTKTFQRNEKDTLFFRLKNSEGGTAYVRITFTDNTTSTSEVLRDFLTFQNPVTNTLKLNTDFDCDVQIYNQNGQLVDETKTSAFSDNTIDFSDKINGMYIMVVRKGDAVFKERILKQ